MVEKPIPSSRILRKKTSLQNLNWEKVSRQKSACLDNEDPRDPCMPQPTQTNWIERIGQ